MRFHYVSLVKVVPTYSMESRYFITYSTTVVSVTIDNGLPPMTRNFLVYCCTILLVDFLNLNFFKFSTLLGL
jgi:hypothetical protein